MSLGGPNILLVDDDPLILKSFQLVLSQHKVTTAGTPETASRCLSENEIDVVLLDLNLPGTPGQELLKAWKAQYPSIEIIVCSGQKDLRLALDCLKLGASDYLVKPATSDEIQLAVARALEKQALRERLERLNPLVRPRAISFLGEAEPTVSLRQKMAQLRKQPQFNILILGESGTGKEVVAQCLHQQEGEPDRPFVVVNMAALPSSLIESELFGTEKGAYTDAKQSRAGKFEMADGGDIFLDEIGDLPLEMQAKLLRVLQEKQVQRLGSHRLRSIAFRTLAATNRSLAELVAEGRFREDLTYRLSDVVLWIPPLRERPSDIPLLVEHFLQKHAAPGKPLPKLGPSALSRLCSHAWPGNVRQLESTIKRALVFSSGPTIHDLEIYDPAGLTPSKVESGAAPVSYSSQMENFERQLLESAIKKCRGNKTAAFESLQIPKATFYRKLQDLGIA